jgi:hypothetical protein
MGQSLQLLLTLVSAVILRSESDGTHVHILLFLIRDSPNLEGQVPIFISPRNRLSQLYPQTLGSLFVASYDSQGYGGGIQTHLPLSRLPQFFSLYVLGADPQRTPFILVYCFHGNVFASPSNGLFTKNLLP